ncbi:TetR/AcrR family transcriptional regulator [Hyphomonas sp.]|uniref:TetR/AcrR family transcriptional regulator n=1 Tax=Hyphomonas sp. TaxID=87 RepID=UPI0035664AAF
MPAPRKHRDAILASAVKLFRRQGYAATGLAEILNDSGAPKGSLYHYFPAGKAEIGAEAVALAGAKVTATLQDLAAEAQDPGELIARYLTLLAGWMRQSGFRDGCPITTTLLETVPEQDAIRAAGVAAFAGWSDVLEVSARKSGIAPERAAKLARFSIAVLEGALIQCRVAGDESPLAEASAELRALFDAARP